MIFATESSLIDFAKSVGQSVLASFATQVFELVGDVGAGKTTFTRGLALGLGITEPVTSPSFNISKRYSFARYASADASSAAHREATPVTQNELIHYDFYRLDDPGLMSFELEEALSEPRAVIVVEWAGSVADLLPSSRIRIDFRILDDGSRELTFDGHPTLERKLS